MGLQIPRVEGQCAARPTSTGGRAAFFVLKFSPTGMIGVASQAEDSSLFTRGEAEQLLLAVAAPDAFVVCICMLGGNLRSS